MPIRLIWVLLVFCLFFALGFDDGCDGDDNGASLAPGTFNSSHFDEARFQ